MVQPAWTEQGAVKTVRSVGGCDHHHVCVAYFLVVQLLTGRNTLIESATEEWPSLPEEQGLTSSAV